MTALTYVFMDNFCTCFRHDWNNMNDIVTTFNTAVKKVRDKEKKREATRPSRQMLRHILQQVIKQEGSSISRQDLNE